MTTFTVFDGAMAPKVSRGKRQMRLAQFAYYNPCWHSMPSARTYLVPEDAAADRRAIRALAARGVLEIDGPRYRWAKVTS